MNDKDHEILTLYLDMGWSLREIARVMGRSHEGIRSVLKRYGVTLRPMHVNQGASYQGSHPPKILD